MSHVRILLDSVEVDFPLNGEDIAIRYERDKSVNGLFTKYSSQIEFIGTGYDAIQTARATSMCETIDVDVQTRCGKFDTYATLFSGFLRVQDVNIDTIRCIARADVELSDCAITFLDQKDRDVDWIAEETLGGVTSLTNNLETVINPFENQSGASYAGLGYNTYKAISAFNLFDHIFQYLTDGCATLVSDFFSTEYEPQIIRIDFTTAPATGDQVTIEFTSNLTGDVYTCVTDIDFVTPGTTSPWQDIESTILLADPYPNYFTEPARITRSAPGGGVVQRYDIYCYHEMTVTQLSVGTGAATSAVHQDYQDGGSGVYITTGQLIKDTATTGNWLNTHTISLETLFDYLTRTFDLGMSIEISGGNTEVRIERSEYFLSTTASATFRGLPELRESFDQTKLAATVILGLEAERYDQYTPAPGGDQFPDNEKEFRSNRLKYNTPDTDCAVIDREIPKEFYTLMGEKIDLVASGQEEFDDDYFMIWTRDSAGQPEEFPFTYEFYRPGTPATSRSEIVKNKPVWLDVIVHYHNYTLPETNPYSVPGVGNLSIVTTTKRYDDAAGTFTISPVNGADITYTEGDGYAPKLVEFERNITADQFTLIVNTQKITFNNTTDVSLDESGFIDFVEYRLSDGFTKFRLLAKET